jgi:hypothetical protein
MGKLILQLLQEMYGSKFVRNLIGTRTNVVKPKQFDTNAPTKSTYSKDAYNDPKLLETIEEKLIEYAPFQIANRNRREQENYYENLKKLRDARKKQQGITEQMETVKEVKPEAEVFDIGTKKKVGEEGIMTLKSEVGLPKGVEPGSIADKAIKESAEYKMNQQGVKSLLDEDYVPPKTTTIDEDEAFEFEKFDKDPRRPGGPLDPAVGITRAGARLVLENKGIKIGSKDPLDLVRENFGQDFLNDINNLSEEMLEIDRRGGSYRDLTDLLKKEGLYDAPINKNAPKGYTAEEMKKIMDEADEKDLGDKLKDYDGDPDGLAEGGRIGFAGGGIKAILALINKKTGKDVVKTADKIDQPDSAKLKKEFEAFEERNRLLTDEEYEDFVEEIGDNIEAYDMPQTIADRDKILKDMADYKAEMFQQYKMGKLDPKPGEPGRKEFLERKLEEAELSGDSRLITLDERDELMMLQTEELAPQMTERMQLKIRYPGITDDLIKKIMIDDNPQRKAEVLATLDEAFKMMDKGMSSDEILNTVKNTPRTKNASGGLNYLMGM